ASIETYVTPRRLVALVSQLAPAQRELRETVRGPREDVAQKNPKALEGFCKRNSITPDKVQYREEAGVRFAFADVAHAAPRSTERLGPIVEGSLSALQSPKNMRWLDSSGEGAEKVAFNRPVRWIVALYGEAIVPASFAGVTSGQRTRGGRYDGSPEIEV